MNDLSVIDSTRTRTVVVVALLGLLGDRGDVGRVGRHGELFLDAGDGRGACDSAGCCFVYLESPLSSSRIKLNGFKIRKVLQTPQNVTNKVVGTKCQTYLHLYLGIRPSFPSLSLSSVSCSSSRYERCRYQRRLCVVAVRDLKEVGIAGDGRNGILTAGPFLTQKLIGKIYVILPLNCTYFS